MRILVLGIFLFQSCVPKSQPEYIALLNKTTAQFNEEMLKVKQLSCRGFGGSFMYDISGVTQHYRTTKKCDVVAARRLVVTSVERLIDMINADPKLHPFLSQNPFPSDNVKFSIAFVDKKGHEYIDGSVAYVSMQDGRIYYDKRNAITGKLEDLWQENYCDALRIVQSEGLEEK